MQAMAMTIAVLCMATLLVSSNDLRRRWPDKWDRPLLTGTSDLEEINLGQLKHG
jgi:hypothetical protein